MDIDGSNSLNNGNPNSKGSKIVNEERKSTKRDVSNPLFVNHELAWHEMRRAWVGDGSQTSHTKFRQPILSWTTSFEDLLSSGETFPDPIPLADVVDLLVDIWIEEGCSAQELHCCNIHKLSTLYYKVQID
ncbi:uncharacterized protein LOC111916360 isoform X2 [Lactuca sativa]|uniref:uncharacterized protein LOC111916360 isoform X2 n=1 Tax=Lactuca sativa TaxID=4236 RepID=UPI001C68D411|nr:uncharacterized protein LOC111916360 isoform X2 [Lactuca sativa]